MPLLFAQLCDLLSALEDFSTRDPPILPSNLSYKKSETIKSWCIAHRVSINSAEVDAVALLSALFPAKRTDRVYFIKPPGLTRSLRRWLGLGQSRWPQLDQWQTPGRGDLSDCVERVLQQAEFPTLHTRDRVTLDQVDHALATVAARCRFSAPKVRAREMDNDDEVGKALENVYRRLQSREAKWFTRLILKESFPCSDLPANLIYACIDSRLPIALQLYHDFESAVTELRSLPVDPARGQFTQQCTNNTHLLQPRIGVKLGPPRWVKAKGGVKHAISIIDGRTMSVERKHDGEYCQIHIDLSKGENCIQIFSKSGKDSTSDRKGVHQAIRDGLRIGQPSCKFAQKCILEGELVVYSDRTRDILPFHKIRKHVSRSGSFLGTALDSQPHYWEHLMIVYYDVMLIDDDPVLHKPHCDRSRLLKKLVRRIEGRADCTYHTHVRFSKADGPANLRKALALAFVRRWEGLVLKPYDEPYFQLERPVRGRYPSRWIKLKKDCIQGLGDTADFAVIGGGYDAGKAAKSNLPALRWTHFYIGCLRNKPAVVQCGAKPSFFVFDEISDCIKASDMKALNELGMIREMTPDSLEATHLFDIEYASGLSRMTAVFRCPFVFDVAGSGFDKQPNRDIFALRFPRVMKIHWDRDWKEAVGLQELQLMATEAMTIHANESDKAFHSDIRDWEEKLSQLDGGTQSGLLAWDSSDNEDDADDEDLTIPAKNDDRSLVLPAKASVGKTVSRVRRRSQGCAPPLFVRMDTKEMQSRERRLSSGEVVERPTSRHSMASVISDGSLQTPPNSSPLSRSDDICMRPCSSADYTTHMPSKQRKRNADKIPEAALKQTKKARPQVMQRSNKQMKTPYGSNFSESQALGEITNNARPSVSHQSRKQIQHAETSTTLELSLVRKLPLTSGEIVPRKYVKPRIAMEPSSPAREMTATPSTTVPATQSTVDHVVEAGQTSSTPRSDARPDSRPPSLLTPPSTANPGPTFSIPNLEESKIILSPNLIKNHIPIPPVQKLLTSLSTYPSSFRQAVSLPQSPQIVASTVKDTRQIILVIDSFETEASKKAIAGLLDNIRIWHPISVAVWDWGILDAINTNGTLKDGYRRKEVGNLFYAEMTWNPQWEGEGAGEVRWRDGSVDRVLGTEKVEKPK